MMKEGLEGVHTRKRVRERHSKLQSEYLKW
jgi:hypothetical protein